MHHVAQKESSPHGSTFANAYSHYVVEGGNLLHYDETCAQVGFPAEIAPEMLGHFAGPNDGGWEVFNLWTDQEAMEAFFRDSVVDAASRAMQVTGVRADIEPEIRKIARLVVGPDARRYTLDEVGVGHLDETELSPVATVIEYLGGDEREYLAGCASLGFPASIPEGMIVHMAGPNADGWRVVDCWNSAEQCDAWMESVRKSILEVDAGSGMMNDVVIRRIELVRALIDPRLAGGGFLES